MFIWRQIDILSILNLKKNYIIVFQSRIFTYIVVPNGRHVVILQFVFFRCYGL